MIFQPQRSEHRKANSQSSSWGSAQGKGNSNLLTSSTLQCTSLSCGAQQCCLITLVPIRFLPHARLTSSSVLLLMPCLTPPLPISCCRLKVRQAAAPLTQIKDLLVVLQKVKMMTGTLVLTTPTGLFKETSSCSCWLFINMIWTYTPTWVVTRSWHGVTPYRPRERQKHTHTQECDTHSYI